MSRSKLANAELRFYTSSGGSETTKIKLVPTNDILTLQGQAILVSAPRRQTTPGLVYS